MTAIQSIRDVYEDSHIPGYSPARLQSGIGEALGAITTPDEEPISPGLELAYDERIRQINQENYDAGHDQGHSVELALAGASYAQFAAATVLRGLGPEDALAADAGVGGPDDWPWDPEFWKPTGDPVRDLVKATALLGAALDSLIIEQEQEEGTRSLFVPEQENS